MDMLNYCLRVEHPALFVQMRLGKTIVTIRSLKVRGCKKNLIVAPYSALYSWYIELLLENQEELGIVELFGTKQERLNTLEENYDSARWFLLNKEGHRVIPEISDFYFNSLIIDESTFIKAPYSQRKGCATTRFYSENFREVDHRFILTGTPAPESELDYFCQLRFLSRVMFKEQNYWEFRHRNFGIINHTPLISPNGSKYLTNILAKNCYFLNRSDVKLGGKKIYEKRKVEMSKNVRKIYEKVEKEFVLEYMGMVQDTIYATTKYIWLRRLCGGFADQEFISYGKLKELENLLDGELKGEKVIVVAKHVNEVKKIAKYFSKKYRTEMIYGGVNKQKRKVIYADFQNGKIDILSVQPETVKHGTNLSASDVIIFYTSPDGGETRMQIEDRIIDTAKNDSSLIIDLFYEDSVEEDVLKNIRQKKSKQSMMKEMVQRLQRKHNINAISK